MLATFLAASSNRTSQLELFRFIVRNKAWHLTKVFSIKRLAEQKVGCFLPLFIPRHLPTRLVSPALTDCLNGEQQKKKRRASGGSSRIAFIAFLPGAGHATLSAPFTDHNDGIFQRNPPPTCPSICRANVNTDRVHVNMYPIDSTRLVVPLPPFTRTPSVFVKLHVTLFFEITTLVRIKRHVGQISREYYWRRVRNVRHCEAALSKNAPATGLMTQNRQHGVSVLHTWSENVAWRMIAHAWVSCTYLLRTGRAQAGMDEIVGTVSCVFAGWTSSRVFWEASGKPDDRSAIQFSDYPSRGYDC